LADAPFATAHLTEIEPLSNPPPGEPQRRPLRHHFGISAFGTNVYYARANGDRVIDEHDELPGTSAGEGGQEELYFVVRGHATFTLGDETVEARAGTFVFVRDPALTRAAVARTAGTAVLTVGGWPDRPFSLSPWERRAISGTPG
jgi:hypothetical protein